MIGLLYARLDTARPTLGRRAEPRQVIEQAFERAIVWIDRARQRRQLLALSDYELRDIGISRCDAVKEGDKPFWRA
jgi:uncharacterized protein YjiS (DUF1127 family)